MGRGMIRVQIQFVHAGKRGVVTRGGGSGFKGCKCRTSLRKVEGERVNDPDSFKTHDDLNGFGDLTEAAIGMLSSTTTLEVEREGSESDLDIKAILEEAKVGKLGEENVEASVNERVRYELGGKEGKEEDKGLL